MLLDELDGTPSSGWGVLVGDGGHGPLGPHFLSAVFWNLGWMNLNLWTML